MSKRIALLAVAVLTGCGHGRTSTLVRIDQEPPGANCPDGGVAVQTGLDDNRNGTVEDDEITSTSYVCGGAKALTCEDRNAISGIITISNSADLAKLDTIGCIDGELLIAGYEEAELPPLSLEVVTGGITLAGNPELTSLDGLGGVTAVGGIYAVQGNDSLVDISALGKPESIASVIISGNDSLPDLVGLERWIDIHHNVMITNNAHLESLHGLENLASTTDGLTIRGNRRLTSLAALDRLRSAAVVEISGNASLPSLRLAALEKVNVTLVINSNDSLAAVALPSLATLAGLQLRNNLVLATINVPSLVVTALFDVGMAPALTAISAPKFSTSTGNIELVQLPALRTVDFAALSTIGGHLIVNGLSTLPDLRAFDSLRAVSGDVALQGNTALTSLGGLDQLETIGGNLTIANNAGLTSLAGLHGSLSTIEGNLMIVSNPALPASAAQAFASGVAVGGTTTIN